MCVSLCTCVFVYVCTYSCMLMHNACMLMCASMYFCLSVFICAHVSVHQFNGCPAGLCFEPHMNMPTTLGSSGVHSPFPLPTLISTQHIRLFWCHDPAMYSSFYSSFNLSQSPGTHTQTNVGLELVFYALHNHHHGASNDQSQCLEYNPTLQPSENEGRGLLGLRDYFNVILDFF